MRAIHKDNILVLAIENKKEAEMLYNMMNNCMIADKIRLDTGATRTGPNDIPGKIRDAVYPMFNRQSYHSWYFSPDDL